MHRNNENALPTHCRPQVVARQLVAQSLLEIRDSIRQTASIARCLSACRQARSWLHFFQDGGRSDSSARLCLHALAIRAGVARDSISRAVSRTVHVGWRGTW